MKYFVIQFPSAMLFSVFLILCFSEKTNQILPVDSKTQKTHISTQTEHQTSPVHDEIYVSHAHA